MLCVFRLPFKHNDLICSPNRLQTYYYSVYDLSLAWCLISSLLISDLIARTFAKPSNGLIIKNCHLKVLSGNYQKEFKLVNVFIKLILQAGSDRRSLLEVVKRSTSRHLNLKVAGLNPFTSDQLLHLVATPFLEMVYIVFSLTKEAKR